MSRRASHRAPRWLLLAVALVVVTPLAAAAQTYRWTDDRGAVHYSQGLDSVPPAFRKRAVRVPDAPPSSKTAPAPEVTRETVLTFTPGEPIYVQARINQSENARLILDTGADRTVITPRALVAAGVAISRPPAATGRMQGVAGGADVQGFHVDSIQVGNARVDKMVVISHDIGNPGVDGLLGRDFLDHFNLTIDSRAGRLILAPK